MTAMLCPDDKMIELTQALEQPGDDVARIDRMLTSYPDDPRLHFLKGSVLAGQQRSIEAHALLTRAVELAPDFHLARYQLGFFQLTSGEADAALSTWGPLLRLPGDAYLRQFVEGLTALIRDDFAMAIEHMQRGISLNHENEPMNNDVRLLLAEAEKLAAGEAGKGSAVGDAELSATSLLLGQFDKPPTQH
jgi:Flp pilus assembly protein TadD